MLLCTNLFGVLSSSTYLTVTVYLITNSGTRTRLSENTR